MQIPDLSRPRACERECLPSRLDLGLMVQYYCRWGAKKRKDLMSSVDAGMSINQGHGFRVSGRNRCEQKQ